MATGDKIVNLDALNAVWANIKANGLHWTLGKYITNTGTQGSNNGYKQSELIPCHGAANAVVIADTANSNVNAVSFYGRDMKYISGLSNVSEDYTEPETITIPAGAYYLRLSAKKAQTNAGIDFGAAADGILADEMYDMGLGIELLQGGIAGADPWKYRGGRPWSEMMDSWMGRGPGLYELFEYPDDFDGTYKPVNIWTDGKRYLTDFSPDKFKVTGENTKTIYASPAGMSANAGTRTQPKNLQGALEGASSGDTVVLLPGVYNKTQTQNVVSGADSADTPLFDKSINVIGEGDVRLVLGGVVFAGEYDSDEGLWTQDRGTNTVSFVVDAGLTHRWTQVSGDDWAATLALCKATPGSWCLGTETSGGSTVNTVYINSPVKPDVYLMQGTKGIKVTSKADRKLYFENITIIGGYYNLYIVQPDDYSLETVFNRCRFLFSSGGNSGRDAVWANSGHILFLQCRAAYAANDGFNYSPGESTVECQFVEIECVGDNNGTKSGGSDIYNGSTAHSGTKGIRVNGCYFKNRGGNVADVQEGTQTVNLGCRAYDSVSTSDYNQGFSAQQPGAVMWLYSCEAYGNTFDLYAKSSDTEVADGAIIAANTNYTHSSGGGTLTIVGGNHIPANGDLNDYRTPGWYQYSNDTLTGLSHLPAGVTERFALQVIGNGIHPYQMLVTDGKIFLRRSALSGGSMSWRGWYKFEGTAVT